MKPNRKQPPEKPELPAKSTVPIVPLHLSTLDDERICEHASLINSELSKIAAKFVILRACEASNVDFAASELPKLSLSDTLIAGCDLSNVDMAECSGHRVLIENCRMIGFRSTDANWEDLTVKNCQMAYASFGETTFKRAIFEECDLTDADFIHANLEAVTFLNCTLARTRFSEAKCKGMDLRGSELEEIIIGPRELQGVIIEPTQAAVLISHLGVKVKWPDQK